jgi:predicted RNA-binding protein with TRAM domain
MDKKENYVRKERASFVGENKSCKNSSQRRSMLPVFAIGNELDVTITETGKQGDGIAYAEECTIIVPNTSLNEKVKVKIEKIINNNTFKAKRLGETDKINEYR